MANGRCRLHGGLTPRGDQWHRVQPAATPAKTERKLLDQARLAKRRAARLAAMTPEQRERYERWHAARCPGPAARRAAERQRRKAAKAAKAAGKRLGAQQTPPQSAAVRELADAISQLERRARALEGKMSEREPGGVFE